MAYQRAQYSLEFGPIEAALTASKSTEDRTLTNWLMCRSSCDAAGLPATSAPILSMAAQHRTVSCVQHRTKGLTGNTADV